LIHYYLNSLNTRRNQKEKNHKTLSCFMIFSNDKICLFRHYFYVINRLEEIIKINQQYVNLVLNENKNLRETFLK